MLADIHHLQFLRFFVELTQWDLKQDIQYKFILQMLYSYMCANLLQDHLTLWHHLSVQETRVIFFFVCRQIQSILYKQKTNVKL